MRSGTQLIRLFAILVAASLAVVACGEDDGAASANSSSNDGTTNANTSDAGTTDDSGAVTNNTAANNPAANNPANVAPNAAANNQNNETTDAGTTDGGETDAGTADAGDTCGDGTCDPNADETAVTCPSDCANLPECADGLDNDGDGDIDFRPGPQGDPECDGPTDDDESM